MKLLETSSSSVTETSSVSETETSAVSVTDKNVPLRIVAGDVLYKSALIQPFFNVISSLLEYPESKMLLCHVPRADVDHKDVLVACDEYKLQVIEISSEIWKKDIVVEYSTPDDYERAKLYLIEKK